MSPKATLAIQPIPGQSEILSQNIKWLVWQYNAQEAEIE